MLAEFLQIYQELYMPKSLISRILKTCLFSISVSGIATDLLYVVNNGDDTLSALNAITMTPISGSPFPLIVPIGPVSAQQVVVNPSGTRIYVTLNSTNSLSVLDGTTFAPILGSPFPTGAFPFGIAINSTGTRLFIADNGTNTVTVLDADTLAFINTVMVGPSPQYIAISPSGIVYVSSNNISSISAFDAATLAHIPGSPFMAGNATGIAVSPDGTTVYTTDPILHTVTARDATNLLTILAGPTATGGMNPQVVAVNPDPAKPYVYVTNVTSNTIALFDSITLSPIGGPILTGGFNPDSIAVSPDGTRVYVTNISSSTISVFDERLNPIDGSPFSGVGFVPFGLALFFAPGPRNLLGVQKMNDFGLSYEFFNLLKWGPSTTRIAGYYVYRDGMRIATLGSTTLQYEDHNREEGISTLYTVTSFNDAGVESSPFNVEIQ